MLGFGGLAESSDSVPGSKPRFCFCLCLDGTASFHPLRRTDWAVSPGFCLCHVDGKDRKTGCVDPEFHGFPGLGRACVADGITIGLEREASLACEVLPRGPSSPLSLAQSSQPCTAFLLLRPSMPRSAFRFVQRSHHFPLAFAGGTVFEGVCSSDGGRRLFLP